MWTEDSNSFFNFFPKLLTIFQTNSVGALWAVFLADNDCLFGTDVEELTTDITQTHNL